MSSISDQEGTNWVMKGRNCPSKMAGFCEIRREVLEVEDEVLNWGVFRMIMGLF